MARKEDLSLLALFLIVLLVFGVQFFMKNPNWLEQEVPDVEELEEYKEAANVKAEKTVIDRGSLVGLAVCLPLKQKADKAFAKAEAVKDLVDDDNNNYKKIYVAAEDEYRRNFNKYLSCLGKV